MMSIAYVEYHSLGLQHLCRERPCTGTERVDKARFVRGGVSMKCGGLCRHSHMGISGSYRARGGRQARFPGAGPVWRSVLDVIGGKIQIQPVILIITPERSIHKKVL